MDNVYCEGSENEITSCRFDGWGHNDCDFTEAAGVICQENETEGDGERNNIREREDLM